MYNTGIEVTGRLRIVEGNFFFGYDVWCEFHKNIEKYKQCLRRVVEGDFFFALRQSFVLDEKTKKKSNRTSYVEPTRKKEKISSLKIITIQSAREVSVPRARDRNDKL